MTEPSKWFSEWFNKDYINLYSHRTYDEGEAQVNFILSHLVIKKGAVVLDLGCGRGRHAIAFAKKGFDTIGIDLSTHLIEEGKKNIPKGLPLQLIQGDFFEFNSLQPFDLITNLFTSFGYFADDDKNMQLFYKVKELLRPGGYFFLDYLNPQFVIDHLVQTEEKWVAGEKVLIKRKIIDGQIIKEIDFPTRSYTERVRLYSKEQVVKMLEGASLKVLQHWGGYSSPSGDSRMLLLCQYVE